MTTPTTPPRAVVRATDALTALLADPLDQGYRDAARRADRRGPGHRRRSVSLTAGGAFLIGVLLAVAVVHASRGAPSDARARADLRARVTAAQQEAAGLGRSAGSLQSQVENVGAAALGAPTNPTLDAGRLQAGSWSVHGPGITVELGNPPAPASSSASGRPGSTPIGARAVLTDLDVRAVVNELWSVGAQAVAVNGVRLGATSTIRFAGLTVLVDFQPVTSPYTVAAIGNSDALITSFTDSAVAEKYRTLASADGVRWVVDQRRDIVLPASVVPAARYAHVPSGTGAAQPSLTPPGPAGVSSSSTRSSPTPATTTTEPSSGGTS